MRLATTLLASCALVLPLPAATQAQAPTQEFTANCKKPADPAQACDVTVIVPAGCGSGIHVAPEPLVVEKGVKKITWTIRSSGNWVFDTSGIRIHDGSKEGNRVYKTEEKGKAAFTLTRISDEAGIFKYDINLKRGASETCKHDPTVINQ